MINIKKTTENKLFVIVDGNQDCKPWGLETVGNHVKLKSLIKHESVYEGHFSDFAVDNVPFASLEAFTDFVSPCLGFSPASGGSEADLLVQAIHLTEPQIKSIGSSPVNLLPDAPEGKYYEIDRIVSKIRPGITPYNAMDLVFTGCLEAIIDSSFLSAGVNTVNVTKESFRSNYFDGDDYYPRIASSFLMDFASRLTLTTLSGANPTDGTGEIYITVYYRLATFSWSE